MNPFFIARLLGLRHAIARRDRWTRAELQAYQARELAKLRAFALARSPFYRDFHRGLEGAPLSALPVLTKAKLMENFDALMTDRSISLADAEKHMAGPEAARRLHGRYVIAATSGTTGARGLFLYDDWEWVRIIASYARANDWAGIPVGLTKKLRLGVVTTKTPWHQSALVGKSLTMPFLPTLRLDSTESPEALVRQLNAFDPESLVSYPSVLRLLAAETKAGRLRIKPQAVFAAAEVLTEEDREKIHEAWGILPFNLYGATETAGIASECVRHNMHLYEDMILTENVDEKYRPVPAGEYGDKLLVTVLFSRTIPLIRYEMTDSVRFSNQACACGRPFALMDGIQGRTEDILHFPGADGEVVIHPNVFHNCLEAVPAREWQVQQDSPDSLKILLVGTAPSYDFAGPAEAIRRELSQRGARLSGLRWEAVAALPKGGNGKISLVKRFSVHG